MLVEKRQILAIGIGYHPITRTVNYQHLAFVSTRFLNKFTALC